MKWILVFIIGISQANASLPRGNISNVGVSLYGVFMTSDPSCQTGLISSLPLSKTPQSSNFVSAPILGAGSVPNRLGCIVLVVANQIQLTWQVGTYAAPDNVCSAGGSANVSPCTNTNINWPANITQSAQAIGLSLSSNCAASPTGNEVVPIFLSINSVCTGSSVIDQQTTGCSVAGKSTSSVVQAPSTISSSSSGAKLQAIPINGRIVFAVDPDQIISGQSGTCLPVSAPVFSIHQ